MLKATILTVSLYIALCCMGASLQPKVAKQYPKAIQPTFKAIVSAYSALDSCHYKGCVMASGKRAYVGAVACPRAIALGTKVTIRGTVYTCEDRTAKFVDGRYDIFYGYSKDDYKRALQHGVKQEEILFE